MSSLSTLFGGGNVSIYSKDPRILGRYKVANYGCLSVFGFLHENPIFFTPAASIIESQGAIASITAADTYVTITDINGSGFFLGAISPTFDTGSSNIATFRITVDGTQFIIASPAFLGSASNIYTSAAKRFILGTLLDSKMQYTSAETPNDGIISYNNFNNFSTDSGYARSPQYLILPHNEQVLKYKFPVVRFDTSLKVECKASSFASSVASFQICSAQYKLDT